MNNEELKLTLSELFTSATFEDGGEWITIFVDSLELKNIMQQLRSGERLDFDYLFCLTCIDWKTHFTMVYHVTSTFHRHSLVVKSKLDKNNAEIDTISDIWRTAEFHEREVYDLFGVKFKQHPDLRRLFMTDDW